jgi:hypothetical protein
MRLHSLLTSAALVAGLAWPAWARENYAILIGASQYPNLEERYWLTGPGNDVDLVRAYLTSNTSVPFAADNVTVLADAVEGGTAPTLAAIRGAMADLAGRLQAGDFVYLHFSGHGSQSPARDPDAELDGLDELFLPVDIGPWNDSVGEVENALVDDEIGQMITSLRTTGATVWAVFDSCHSGTVTRAAPTGDDDVRLRKLDGAALGIPDARMDAVVSRALPGGQPRAESAADTGDAGGGFVAFYAAQTNETTPEKRLPRGAPDRRSQGVFTYTLFQTLASRPGITYRQLGQEILRQYAVDNLARSTPMFEGDLDQPVFGSGSGRAAPQWPVQTGDGAVKLGAGRLHGLAQGMRLALLASPADPDDAALGYFEVDHADTFGAELVAVAEDGKPALATDAIPAGAWLRKQSEALDFGLTVALPEPGSVAADRLDAALAAAQAQGLIGPRIGFVAAGEDADLRLAVLPDSARPDALWVLPATGILTDTGFTVEPSIGTGDKTPDELAEVLGDTLGRIARVQNLLKLGSAYGGDDVDVEIELQTRSPSEPRLHDLETLPVPRLVPDDEVHVLALNNEAVPVDLNVLYIGSDYSITHMFAGRLQPGDQLKQGLLRITDEAFGRDRVVMILSPAERHSAIEDLGFLQQDEMPATRGTGASGFAAALADAGFGATTRAAAPLGGGGAKGPAPAIVMFDLDTRPAD